VKNESRFHSKHHTNNSKLPLLQCWNKQADPGIDNLGPWFTKALHYNRMIDGADNKRQIISNSNFLNWKKMSLTKRKRKLLLLSKNKTGQFFLAFLPKIAFWVQTIFFWWSQKILNLDYDYILHLFYIPICFSSTQMICFSRQPDFIQHCQCLSDCKISDWKKSFQLDKKVIRDLLEPFFKAQLLKSYL